MASTTRRFESRLSNAMMWCGGVALFAMMLHICADVISRQLLGRPVTGTLEFVTYVYMLSVVFLPLAVTQEERAHVLVELFMQRLSPRAIARVDAFVNLFCAAYVSLLTWFSTLEAIRSTRRNEVITLYAFDMPLWPTRWLLTAGLGGMLVVLIMQVVRHFRGEDEGGHAPSFASHLEI